MSERAKTTLILAVVAAWMIGFGIWFFKTEAASHEEVAVPTKELVRALNANQPSAAPPGTGGYVKGIRKHFGRVRRARFLDAFTERSGSHRTAQTDVVSEILVRGKRGAGVLLLEFEGAELSSVDEVEPSLVHSDLDPRTEAALRRGYARRGGRPRSLTMLSPTNY